MEAGKDNGEGTTTASKKNGSMKRRRSSLRHSDGEPSSSSTHKRTTSASKTVSLAEPYAKDDDDNETPSTAGAPPAHEVKLIERVQKAKTFRRSKRSLSYSSFLREDSDSALLFNQVRQAFLTSGALILGMGAIVLLYYNYIMLQSYIIPFFWAVTFSVLLRKPRAHLLTFLEGLKQKERKLKQYPFWHVWWAKAQFFGGLIRHPHFSANMLHFLGMVLGIFATCGYFGWWLSSPLLFALVIPSILALLVAVCLIVVPSSYHTTFVSVILLLSLFIATVLATHFFAVKTLDEASRGAGRVQILVQNIITDEKWTNTLNEYGLTPDQIQSQITNAQSVITVWLQGKGIDLDQLKKELDLLGGFGAGNITAHDTWKHITHFWQNDTSLTGAVEYLGNFNMERIGDQFRSVLGFLFGTVGIGLLTMFGKLGISVFNLITGALVFYTSLYYLIEWDASVLDKLVEILPVVPDRKPAISLSLQKSINSIFVCSYLLCMSHGLVTFLLFKVFAIEFAYSASLISGAIAIFPFIPTILIYMVAAAGLYFQEDPNLIYFTAGTIIAQIGLVYLDQYIYQWIPRSHPYITGLAVVLGVSTFGLEGAVIGPLLIVVTITAYDIFDLDQYDNSNGS